MIRAFLLINQRTSQETSLRHYPLKKLTTKSSLMLLLKARLLSASLSDAFTSHLLMKRISLSATRSSHSIEWHASLLQRQF